MDKNQYELLESPYHMGGIKVKFQGQTCAQFPKIDLALEYVKKACLKQKENYKTIDLIKANGEIEQVKLFDD